MDKKLNVEDAGEIFDIGSVDTTKASNEGAEIELRHPVKNTPTGIFFHVVGRDSDTFRQHQRESLNTRIHAQAMAERRGRDVDPRTAEEIEQDACELLAICTTGWHTKIRDKAGKEVARRDFVRLNGEDFTFNGGNAFRIYKEQLWVRRQIDEAIGDIGNFLKG